MKKPVSETLDGMVADLKTYLQTHKIDDPVLLGIHTGGAWVAQALQARLGDDISLGQLDISFYRDDFSRIGMHPQVRPSNIPFSIENRHVLLVDDVLYTGRTIRAAMNEIFDYGRPASITLVVLVERDGRELPIEAQVVGAHLQLAADEQIKLRGPDPLHLDIVSLEPEDD
ncbi:pyrimidine operon attenuation protein / uracil phosphoribosyltransferase [Ectothiorhodosinus mongolicus]|uniref:Pyrimidine operon attenuation protein / uracil phosphoribosyltransferase n=1 Tax=Ectothiorhodosinus mongolicus TaxID=233100 RepID=A0A1R3VYH7_9GAMM|nr:bifunctional pyr operon transcriptional regulator/uracil phosphoribosyltransferase PyrR [Ectothiorhodosinus mongolicus]ULX57143.1 bifunctional pyr operon transcriptional regulator/uracil phosphoribosyltransferase [Ectothiorhodosinus mongolicus]SIT70117.1 pyrimidine operon attenuation protein / uracil phosphoribosyltransferase [Ectothiorhodosinus mongolicus]